MSILLFGLVGLIFIVIGVLVNILVSLEFYKIAKKKGHEKIRYFWFTFLFGLVGMLMIIALPDRGMVNHANNNNMYRQ